MPLGIRIGQVIAVVREAQVLESTPQHISVCGPGADELAAALAAGGDRAAIVVDGDPAAAAIAIRIVAGPPSSAERAEQRRVVRAGKRLLILRRGSDPVPYALPGDVLEAGPELPLEALAAAVARAAPDAAPALAARLPVLRPAVERRLVGVTSWGNALIAASPWERAPNLSQLSIAQSRMLLLLGAARGEKLPLGPAGIAAAAGPPLAAAVAVGFTARGLVRRLPVRGPLVRAAVAYAGTRALGAVRLRLP